MHKPAIITVVIVSCLFLAGFVAWDLYTDFADPRRPVDVSVGTFPTWDVAVSASLQQLSQEIARHPDAERYYIHFRQGVRDQHGVGGAVTFIPFTKQLGFERDPGSGFDAYWTNVDSVAIGAAAATNGTFLSFGREAWYSKSSYAP